MTHHNLQRRHLVLTHLELTEEELDQLIQGAPLWLTLDRL